MGFGDFIKKAAPFINPTVALGTGAQFYGDYEAKMGAKSADSTTREINASQLQLARDNMAMQREFAQHGIRWRAEDAAAAGLHPLAALGASGASYNPVSAMIEAPTAEARNRGNMWSNLGQNVSRAAMATMTMEERAITRLRIEGADLDNEIKRAQLRQLESQPALPSPDPGQPDANWQETTYPFVAYGRTPSGLVPMMPPKLAEALESDESGQTQWILRFRGGPNVYPKERPSRNLLPPGASGWIWSELLQEWQPKTSREAAYLGRRAAERHHRPIFNRDFQRRAPRMRDFPEYTR